ncbi:hypothetical protein AB0I55_12610 [Actinocatenispora sera]|uniref:hypothetical protein n=1 Tax=Actinocatenispora sera TaxID=390989 RepID=UPI0034021410
MSTATNPPAHLGVRILHHPATGLNASTMATACRDGPEPALRPRRAIAGPGTGAVQRERGDAAEPLVHGGRPGLRERPSG